jgi:hypothetical protein
MNPRRLDAEEIRDSILAATGELDLRMGGSAVDFSKPRRTVYARVTRNIRDPQMDVFDAPENFVSTSQRNTTTTPTQALLMMNSPTMLQRAQAFAIRLKKENLRSDMERVEAAYRLALGRKPCADEARSGLIFLAEQRRRIPTDAPKTMPFLAEKMPYRERNAAVLQPQTPQDRLEVPDSPSMPVGDFTIEAHVLLRSVYDDASVRTIASHWDGKPDHPGWAFGVTSKKSMNKPQTLVLQLSAGESRGAEPEPVFSGLRLELNKPYFVAASVNLSDTNDTGIIFYLKDISNDCEPIQVVGAKHALGSLAPARAPFAIGGHHGDVNHLWDGLIDDIRLSDTALRTDQLLVSAETVTPHCVGYWRFDSNPSVYKDISNHGNDILPKARPSSLLTDPDLQALADFCHVLLNSNEFLYVD